MRDRRPAAGDVGLQKNVLLVVHRHHGVATPLKRAKNGSMCQVNWVVAIFLLAVDFRNNGGTKVPVGGTKLRSTAGVTAPHGLDVGCCSPLVGI